jgi:hypothetical protein
MDRNANEAASRILLSKVGFGFDDTNSVRLSRSGTPALAAGPNYIGYRTLPTPSVTAWILNHFQFIGHYAIELEDIEEHVRELEQPAQEANGGRGR